MIVNKNICASYTNYTKTGKSNKHEKSSNRSILKFILVCAMFIGSLSFNTPGYAETFDINNNTTSDNGINNYEYYKNDTTLNVINSIYVETSLPTISNVANLLIQGSESENYIIGGNNVSTIGYTIDNSIIDIKNLTFSNFNNAQVSSGNNEIYGSALYIADNSSNSKSNVTLDNIKFTDNSLTATTTPDTQLSLMGGAIANNGSTTVINSNFSNNKIHTTEYNNALGGAIYNSGTLNSSKTNFTENSVTVINGNAQGGAIYNKGDAMIKENSLSSNKVEASDEGNAYGGAIFNSGNLTLSDTTFSNNTAQTNGTGNAYGGAIYNEGALYLANTTFKNNSVMTTNGNAIGGAIYTNSDIVLLHNNTFLSSNSDSQTNSIYFAGGNLIVSDIGNIISSSLLSKDSTSSVIIENGGELLLEGDNTGFSGAAFVGENSKLTYSGNPLNSILNSTLINGANGSVEFNFDSDYTLNSGIVKTDGNITNGNFIKSGNNTLTLTKGDYSNFSGNVIVNSGVLSYIQDDLTTKYISAVSNTINSDATLRFDNSIYEDSIQNLKGTGIFEKTGNQNLILSGNNSSFTGDTLINGGSLSYNKNTGSTFVNGNVYINNNSALNYTALTSDKITLSSNSKFKFASNSKDATINFVNGNYELKNDITNIGSSNTISIGNANIALNSTDTNHSGNYIITDSLLTLADNKISNITFDNLILNGNNELKIDFNFATGEFDTITTNNDNAGSINLTDIIFLNAQNTDNGNFSGEYNVLNGGLTFANTGSKEISSDIYKYIASYIAGEKTITLNRVSLLKDTLYILNHQRDGVRTFNFVGNDVYYIGKNLDTTSTGTLNIFGNGTADQNVISAKVDADSTGGLSMFDISLADTNLNIKNITIKDAESPNTGSVINSTAANAKISIEDSVITNNKSADGGAIYINNNSKATEEIDNVNPTLTISGSTFAYNTATGRDADPENGLTQIAGNGGALSIEATNAEVNITNTIFEKNKAENFGGAIYNTGKVNLDNVSFKNNTVNNANLRGSAIYNLGNMTIKNSTFNGNGSNGTYIYNGTQANMTISADNGEEIRIDNGNDETIYNGGTLNLTTTGEQSILNIADTISNGTININGNVTISDLIKNANMNLKIGSLTLQKDPTLQASQQQENVLENTKLIANAGTIINLIDTNISNGSIALNVTKNESDEIIKTSVLNIESLNSNTPNYEGIKISSNLSDEGTINKTGEGKLVFTGTSNRDFLGTLNINEGNVEFLKTTSNTFFGSESVINVSPNTEFIYHSTDTKENFIGSNFSNITLNGTSTLSVIGNGIGNSKFTLDKNWFTSNGSEANNIIFSDAAYTINSIIDRPAENNPANILDNVEFKNSEISIGTLDGTASNTYTGATDYDFGSNNYSFEDSQLSFSNRVTGDTFHFDNLEFKTSENGNKNGIALDLNLLLGENGEYKPYSDKFVYENGSGIVEITELYIADDDGIFQNGSKGLIKLFEGGTEDNHIQVTFADNTSGLGWATNKYLYNITVATTDLTNDSIEITDGGLSNADTLRDMNVFGADTNGGSRGFSFLADEENGNIYNISRDFGNTSAKTFTVVGDIDKNGNKTIISGNLTDIVTREGDSKLQVDTTGNSITYDGIEIPSEYYTVNEGEYHISIGDFLEQSNIQSGETPQGSMFEIVNNTNLEMNNVSIEDAKRYKNDLITDGAAIYASNADEKSNILLNNVDFKNNTVENGRGGAIANIQSGSFALYNSIISGNSASGNGGAIYNSDDLSILNAEFKDNSSGGLGGAIYTSHDILISDTSFIGNTHTNNGVIESNDIYISGEDTQVNFVINSGENSINSGIAGEGYFIKTGEGDLNLTGINKNFKGNMSIIAGDVNYTAKDYNDSFIGGSLKIATGSTLNLDIGENVENQYIQDVSGSMNSNDHTTSGTIIKTGSGTIYLNGKNNSFTGRLNINEGNFKYIADESNEMYFGGSTYIAEGATLYLDIEDQIANQTISTVSGSGLFEKTNGGNINLTGNNSLFTGTANIKDGSVTYIANNTTSHYFEGNTYIDSDAELIANISSHNAEGELIEGQTIGNLSDLDGATSGGNFTKKGDGSLQLTGDNSNLTGTTTIEQGSLIFTNQEQVIDEETGEPTGEILSHNYTSGNTVINKDAELKYTITGGSEISNTINGLGGEGLLTKYGEGELILTKDNKDFTGDIILDDGNLTYNSTYNSATGAGSFLNANSIDISQTSSLNINDMDGETSNLKNVTGNGSINKIGNGTVILSGENNLFDGNLSISKGTVSFTNNDSNSYISGKTAIEEGGALDYTTIAGTNEKLSNISGSGTLNKNGEGTLTFSSNKNIDNTKFTANINEGRLNVNGISTDNIDFNINILNDSILSYTAPVKGNIILGSEDNQRIKFDDNASNATAIFNRGNYTFDGEIKNALGNNITLNNTTIAFANSDIKNTYSVHYSINNSIIDLIGNGINEIIFTDLELADSHLQIDINLDIPGVSTSDKLIIENPNDRPEQITLTKVNITGEHDIGLNETHKISNVVDGDLTMSSQSISNLYTELYHYTVLLDDNKKDLLLTAISATDKDSLREANQMEGTRGFQFRDTDTPYEISNNLGETAEGIFTVWGSPDKQGEIVLSGGGSKSFFDITNNTDFVLTDLTIKDAENTKGGSVIYADNNNAKIKINNTNIISNNSNGNGGAIHNTNSSDFQIIDSVIANNSSSGYGGAIYTNDVINITDTNFKNNVDSNGKNDIYIDIDGTANLIAESAPMEILSGIAGTGTANKIGAEQLIISGNNKDFIGNLNIIDGNLLFTQSNEGDNFILGHTHINDNKSVELNTNLNNTAVGTFSGTGTINKTGTYDLSLSGNNSAFTGTTNIEEGSLTFTEKSNNDKYFAGKTNISSDGTLNINHANNMALSNITNAGNLVVNSESNLLLSKIKGEGSIIKNGSGSLVISGDNKDFTGDLNVNNGTFTMVANSTIGNLANGYFANGTTIDLQNTSLITTTDGEFSTDPNPASMENLYFATLQLDGNVNFDIDVDLKQKIADKIGAEKVIGDGALIIDNQSVNVLSDSLLNDTRVEIAYGDITDNIILSPNAKSVMGPIQKYDVSYEEVLNETGFNRGNLIFTRQGGTTPDITQINNSIMASPVATQVGGYLTQLETLNAGFFHMDRYSKYPYLLRLAAEKSNINAIVDTPSYQKSILPETSNAMWIKPYTTFEQVNLKGGIDVSNVSYGTLYGGDTDLVDLGHGYKGVLSLFLGYNGNNMSYNGISMNQQGGALGATGTLYKGNFFTGLTVSAGASAGEAYTAYGTDNFAMLNAGIASKTGYNWEIKEGKVIVQPTLFLGYTFVNTFDYTTAAGVKVDSDPLHAIQVVPGIKIIGNLKNGWQPYLGANMVWSIMDKTSVMANDVRLPQLSIKPYVEYGIGIQKNWGERFTAFFQTMIRNGGRTGVALSAGFRWTIGKDKPNNTNKPVKKTVIKSL